jgi:hypothetical protein
VTALALRFLRHHASRPPLAKIRPGSPAPATGPGTASGWHDGEQLASKTAGKPLASTYHRSLGTGPMLIESVRWVCDVAKNVLNRSPGQPGDSAVFLARSRRGPRRCLRLRPCLVVPAAWRYWRRSAAPRRGKGRLGQIWRIFANILVDCIVDHRSDLTGWWLLLLDWRRNYARVPIT